MYQNYPLALTILMILVEEMIWIEIQGNAV